MKRKAEKRILTGFICFAAALCFCFAPAQNTLAYISGSSASNVNTFEGDPSVYDITTTKPEQQSTTQPQTEQQTEPSTRGTTEAEAQSATQTAQTSASQAESSTKKVKRNKSKVSPQTGIGAGAFTAAFAAALIVWLIVFAVSGRRKRKR